MAAYMSDEKLLSPKDRIAALTKEAAALSEKVLAEKTRYGYASVFNKFTHWCEEMRLPALPTTPEVVVLYLTALAKGEVKHEWKDRFGLRREMQRPMKASTIEREYIAIVHHQREAGVDWPSGNPAILAVLKGIKRTLGTKKKRAQALDIDDLRKCLAAMRERRPDDLVTVRNRAILAIGFWGALRAGEIVGLKIEDLEFCPQGILIHLRKSKGDQEGKGEDVPLIHQKDKAVCPVVLVSEWLRRSELKSGPLFRRIDPRSDAIGNKHMWKDVISDFVREAAERAGIDPERFSGHSLRSGFVTSAAAKGVPLDNIMRQTRHKDERVARTYIRHATVFDHNAAEGLADGEDDGKEGE